MRVLSFFKSDPTLFEEQPNGGGGYDSSLNSCAKSSLSGFSAGREAFERKNLRIRPRVVRRRLSLANIIPSVGMCEWGIPVRAF